MSKQNAEILCIGSELLLGQILNSNAQWLSEEIAAIGLNHFRQTVVGDNINRIKDALIEASNRSEILIITGGLGPTSDDLTHEAIAIAFNSPLEEYKEVWETIKLKTNANNKNFSPSNRKQALLPGGAKVIQNQTGTAPGIIFSPHKGFTLLTFPGVPSEMKSMWHETAVPWLLSNHEIEGSIYSKLLRFSGIKESALAEKVSDLLTYKNPTIAPYAAIGEVKLRITAKAKTIENAKDLIEPIETEVRKRTGDLCYGINNQTLASIVLKLLLERGETLAVAESCTGGGIGTQITAIPGASKIFLGGVIAYSNLTKQSLLDVPQQLIEMHGAVSNEVAKAMAEGVREKLKANWAIAVSGVAGPNGGSPTKPVGLVHIAVVGPKVCDVSPAQFSNYLGREGIQTLSVIHSLNRLRLHLRSRK